GQAIPVRRPLPPGRLETDVRLVRVGRLLLGARAVLCRQLRHGIVKASLPPRPGHQDHARPLAGADEDVLGAGGAVEEVPGPQRPLITFDEQRALPGEDDEVLLLRLGVVEAVRLARLEDVETDPELAEPRFAALERALRPGGTFLPVLRRPPL